VVEQGHVAKGELRLAQGQNSHDVWGGRKTGQRTAKPPIVALICFGREKQGLSAAILAFAEIQAS
jgi:hypothetical protein